MSTAPPVSESSDAPHPVNSQPLLTPFERLPEEILNEILQLADPNSFASLTLLNRKCRQVSQKAHLYAWHLSRCPSYAASHRNLDLDPPEDALPALRRQFTIEAKRHLFDAYMRPRTTDIKLVSTTLSSAAACPGGEAFHFCASPKGRRLLAYSSSRLYILDLTSVEVTILRAFKIPRRPVSTAILDDGSLLAVVSTDHRVDLYDLRGPQSKHTTAVDLLHGPRTIALSPTGSVLAAAYNGGIEVYSLAVDAIGMNGREVKCDAVDKLAFSSDGTQLLGTTTNSSNPCTVVITAPYYDPGALSGSDAVSQLWTSSILFPNSTRDCSHAALLGTVDDNVEATWIFAYDRVFETFRAVRTDDLRNGTTYFTGPVPTLPAQHTLLPNTLPSVSPSGDVAAAGFKGNEIWLYGIPEELDVLPNMQIQNTENRSVAIRPVAQQGVASASTHQPLSEAPPRRIPQWQILCDRLRNTFVEGYHVANLPGVYAVQWVFDDSLRSDRLVAVAPGVVGRGPESEEEAMEPIDGGRISVVDFDYGVSNGEQQTVTIEVGEEVPEELQEEQHDMDAEVAIARRRTNAQQRRENPLGRRPNVGGGPLPSRRPVNNPKMRALPADVKVDPTIFVDQTETSSLNSEEGYEDPYSQGAPRSGLTLRRAATAAAANRHLRRNDGQPRLRPADGSGEVPHESDADNWVPPPPPYSREPSDTLPSFLRHAVLEGTVSAEVFNLAQLEFQRANHARETSQGALHRSHTISSSASSDRGRAGLARRRGSDSTLRTGTTSPIQEILFPLVDGHRGVSSDDVTPQLSPQVSPELSEPSIQFIDDSPTLKPEVSPEVSPQLEPEVSPEVSPEFQHRMPLEVHPPLLREDTAVVSIGAEATEGSEGSMSFDDIYDVSPPDSPGRPANQAPQDHQTAPANLANDHPHLVLPTEMHMESSLSGPAPLVPDIRAGQLYKKMLEERFDDISPLDLSERTSQYASIADPGTSQRQSSYFDYRPLEGPRTESTTKRMSQGPIARKPVPSQERPASRVLESRSVPNRVPLPPQEFTRAPVPTPVVVNEPAPTPPSPTGSQASIPNPATAQSSVPMSTPASVPVPAPLLDTTSVPVQASAPVSLPVHTPAAQPPIRVPTKAKARAPPSISASAPTSATTAAPVSEPPVSRAMDSSLTPTSTRTSTPTPAAALSIEPSRSTPPPRTNTHRVGMTSRIPGSPPSPDESVVSASTHNTHRLSRPAMVAAIPGLTSPASPPMTAAANTPVPNGTGSPSISNKRSSAAPLVAAVPHFSRPSRNSLVATFPTFSRSSESLAKNSAARAPSEVPAAQASLPPVVPLSNPRLPGPSVQESQIGVVTSQTWPRPLDNPSSGQFTPQPSGTWPRTASEAESTQTRLPSNEILTPAVLVQSVNASTPGQMTEYGNRPLSVEPSKLEHFHGASQTQMNGGPAYGPTNSSQPNQMAYQSGVVGRHGHPMPVSFQNGPAAQVTQSQGHYAALPPSSISTGYMPPQSNSSFAGASSIARELPETQPLPAPISTTTRSKSRRQSRWGGTIRRKKTKGAGTAVISGRSASTNVSGLPSQAEPWTRVDYPMAQGPYEVEGSQPRAKKSSGKCEVM